MENIAFAKLILKRPAYLGRDNQLDLCANNPSFQEFISFSVPSLCFYFFSLYFPIPPPLSLCVLSFFCSAGPTCASLTALSAVIETAIVYQRVLLLKRPSRFCRNICTNLLAAASIRCRPLLECKRALSAADNCILLLVYFTNQGDTDDFAVVLCAVISCR